MSQKRILIVDDDLSFLNMLQVFLDKNGYQTQCFSRAEAALKALENQVFQLALTDYKMPGLDGMGFLERSKKLQPALPIIMMTSYGEIPLAVAAMRLGAANYLTKPINADELLKLIGHTVELNQILPSLENKNNSSAEESRAFGIHPVWNSIKTQMKRLAETEFSVMILGESGVGKEFIANWIHENSAFKDGPFVAVDCGSLSEELLSSEMFGHIKGSFTGAHTDKVGFLEAAHQGTLFLDEIGNLSLKAQMLLLRCLQERSFRKLGSHQTMKSRFRIISATNAVLADEVQNGRFRLDLYHRINEFDLYVPPLKQRQVDILFYADLFARDAASQLSIAFSGFSEKAKYALIQYKWPGNLRELRNVIKKTLLFAESPEIQWKNLPNELKAASVEGDSLETLNLEASEKSTIMAALEQCHFNKTKAAEMLQIDRKTLYNKLKRYKLN